MTVPLQVCSTLVAARLATGPALTVTGQSVPDGMVPHCPRCGEVLYRANQPVVTITFLDGSAVTPPNGWLCPCGMYALTGWDRPDGEGVRDARGLDVSGGTWTEHRRTK